MEISRVIKSHGLSISEVACRMEVSKGTLSNMLSRGNLTVDSLHRIAQAIGCRVSEFFDDEVSVNEENFNLTALIDVDGELYRADDFKRLEAIVNTIRNEYHKTHKA